MTRAASLRRPMVRWYGGKWHLAPWIVSVFPRHETYVEPFGGGASVLMRKPRSPVEVLNDLDANVVALYRTLADLEASRELALRCWLTKFEVEDLRLACQVRDDADDLERAHRLVVRGGLAFNSSIRPKTGSGAGIRPAQKSTSRGTTPQQDWVSYRHSVPAFRERLRGLAISQQPAIDVMLELDDDTTLHYADPPYVPTTRTAPDKGYRHELTVSDHVALLEVLRSLRGYVVLSG